jgi:SprT-like protein
LTIEELTRHAKEFLRKNYDMDLTVPIVINHRLKKAMGRFVYYKTSKTPVAIQIAGYVIKYADKTVILDTLYHELIHYALFMQGTPFADGTDSFESELRRLGVSGAYTNRVGVHIACECPQCGKIYYTHNARVKKRPQSYLSVCCRSPIKIIGEKIFDGTEAV